MEPVPGVTVDNFRSLPADKRLARSQTKPKTAWLDGGEMGERIRCFDWSKTELGPMENWSPALQTTLRIILASPFPYLLWWGPNYIQFYNDSYRPVLGAKHPDRALGRPCSQCWDEVWPIIGPLVDKPFHGGPPTWAEDILLEVRRHGFGEETHFTIAYSPVPDDSVPGGIGGVLATVHEITGKVVGDRRVVALRDLSARSSEARTAEHACAIAAQTLANHPKDIPFALLYLVSADQKVARLAGAANAGDYRYGQPLAVSLDAEDSASSPWPFQAALQNETMQVVAGLADRFAGHIPNGPWSDPPEFAAVVPIPSNKAHRLAGFLVAGISSRIQLNGLYRDFLGLVSSQIATAIANAREYEEEKKRAEALAEIDRAKTTFFSNVSHEFRTPLTLMLGPIEELLTRGGAELPPAATSQLEVAHRNSLRLLRLVNSLLDFSRIEAGRIQAVFEPVDLATLTADLVSVFRGATDCAGLKLTVDCPQLSEPVYVDRSMWEKIVLNLVSNAFKFTLDGEIKVILTCTQREVELRVQDTGVGVPADEIPRLFERFHRVENARGRTHEGSGIGLALVQELVKLHGGSVRVESTLGIGSTFIVTNPLGKDHLPANRIGGSISPHANTGAAAFVEEALRWLPEQFPMDANESFSHRHQTEISSPAEKSLPARGRVLVADDNADMRQYVARLLSQDYIVETVPDGRAALAAVRKLRPDLILSDVMMPQLDGIELVRELRSDESLRTIPIILLSARTGEEHHVEGLQQGADDYITKPFSAAELSARVATHLTMARMRREATEKLRQSEDRFRALVTASSDVIYRMNPDWSEMTFLRGREFLADTEKPELTWLQKYIAPADRPGVIAAIMEAVQRKGMFHLEHRVLRRDGSVGWTLSRAVPLLDANGEITEWFGAAIDITERKNAEQALRDSGQRLEMMVTERTAKLQELVRELEHFSYTITHDMRAPLRAMRGFAEVLKELGSEVPAGEQELFLDRIIIAAERMDCLIADALHYSKAMRQQLPLGYVDVGRLLRGMLDSYPEFQSSNADIEIRGDIPLVLGNEAGLTQCLSNLIGNAVKFVEPDTRAKVRIWADVSGDWIRLWVEDQGIGISPEMLPRVFDMFSHGAVAHAGTGIGLALVRTVVQRMGGKVGVESQPGKGSRFWIELQKAN